MLPDEFEERWQFLTRSAIDEKWFNSLLAIYRRLTPSQNAELRWRLGWSAELCVPPPDADVFGAGWSERIRSHFRDHASLVQFMVSSAAFWAADYRDQIIDLAGMYHAAILAGLDPDEVFTEAASQLAPAIAEHIHNFRRRPDKDLSLYGYCAVRHPDGHVHLTVAGF
ncbi:MAG TPA: hypothetical protein VG897_04310 [Terriglobales bacterium]|nr:hypothetical protein [Terriglobales bacterium]